MTQSTLSLITMDEENVPTEEDENGMDYGDFMHNLSEEEICENVSAMDQGEGNEENDDGVFYFETDQLALKANKDYHNLLRTIFILEAQRETAIKAIEKVSDLLQEAENNPIDVIEKLKNGEGFDLPERQKIPEIPSVDWSRYNLPAPPEASRLQNRSRSSIESEFTPSSTSQPESSWENSERRSKILVRGRAFDDTKPETFNQLWTSEEQRRLEELLIEFPPEDVETRRWEKIADALGNRTAKQVQSRVQKYFIKLHKAGLPIPGRCPRLQNETQLRKAFHRHQRNNHFLFKPSTFFPSHDLPMSMSDSEEESSLPKRSLIGKEHLLQDNSCKEALSDSETVLPPVKENHSRGYKKLEMLNKVKKEMEITNGSAKFQHIGYQCAFCKEEPIVGTRWHCDECMSSGESVDYCSDCVVTMMDDIETPFSSINPRPQSRPRNPHPLEHSLCPIRGQTGKTTTGVWDPDYLPDSFSGGYNYLDPNFMPE